MAHPFAEMSIILTLGFGSGADEGASFPEYEKVMFSVVVLPVDFGVLEVAIKLSVHPNISVDRTVPTPPATNHTSEHRGRRSAPIFAEPEIVARPVSD